MAMQSEVQVCGALGKAQNAWQSHEQRDRSVHTFWELFLSLPLHSMEQ